ncbi:MAG: hypothetical protein R6V36_02890, partial [Psychroflexus sp.]
NLAGFTNNGHVVVYFFKAVSIDELSLVLDDGIDNFQDIFRIMLQVGVKFYSDIRPVTQRYLKPCTKYLLEVRHLVWLLIFLQKRREC